MFLFLRCFMEVFDCLEVPRDERFADRNTGFFFEGEALRFFFGETVREAGRRAIG